MRDHELSVDNDQVSIAGVGAVTGYGWSTADLWNGLSSGKPAATLKGGFGADRDEMAWVARVQDGGDARDGRSIYSRALRASAREAVNDAIARGWTPGDCVGVVYATVLPECYEWKQFYLEDDGRRDAPGYLTLMPSTAISMMMKEFGFHGPSMNVSAMCSSGNSALITAKMWMDAGMVDDVVVVVVDLSLTPENVDSFVRLGVGAVDTNPLDASRPFQEGSRGFGGGEAAVSFVLSRESEDPYVAVLGGAMSHDAYHVTSVDPSHEHVFGCVTTALRRSGVAASDVRYINAHGPGTKQCDRAETAVLEEIFESIPEIYSVKPLVGHCQGAAAAVELAAAALGYDRGEIPASPHVAAAHPRLLDGLTPMERGITVKTSLGMGGHNSAVVLAPV